MEYHDGASRSGLPGAWDRLVGPGATVSENAGTVVTAVLGTGIWLADGASVRDWGIMRRAGAALMGAELFGGVRANTTPSATRWYHGRGQGVREMLGFSSLHLHPFLVAAFYRERDWGFALGNYAYLLVATAATAGSPAPSRRAVALVLCCVALWLNTLVWRPTPGLRWFAPVFFLKLLVSHPAGAAPAKG